MNGSTVGRETRRRQETRRRHAFQEPHAPSDGLLIDDGTDPGGGFHQVTVSIPRALAGDGKLFARISVAVAAAP